MVPVLLTLGISWDVIMEVFIMVNAVNNLLIETYLLTRLISHGNNDAE